MVCCGVWYGAVWYGWYGMVWCGKYGMVCVMVSCDINDGGDLRTKYSVVNFTKRCILTWWKKYRMVLSLHEIVYPVVR